MKKLIVIPLLFALTACPGPLVPPPGQIANRTVLDDQLATSVELAYKAARIAVEIAVDTNQCLGSCATRFRDLNRRAYAAVLAVRAAYAAGNSADYSAAARNARALIDELLSLTGRNPQ